MLFLAWLAIELVLFVASALLTPKPNFPDATPEDPSGPRSEEGATLPVVFGTAKVAANVAYFGGVLATEETEHVKTGIFSSKNVTTGYRYSAVFQAVLCHGPIDELLDIVWDNNKSMAALDYGPTEFGEIDSDGDGIADTYGVISGGGIMNGKTSPFLPFLRSAATDETAGQAFGMVGAEGIFGGYQKGGGLRGGFTVFFGTATQAVSKVMQWALNSTNYQQRYEGVCHVVFGRMTGEVTAERFEYGERSVMPGLEFIVRRCPSNLGLTPEQVNLNGGANPAEAIYEVLTDPVWGIAMPPGHIDVPSFAAAGITLAAEGFGLNMSLNSDQSGADVVTEFLRYIDGQVQQHPVTGLAELTLNRDDYEVSDLVLLNEDNVADCQISRPSWVESRNEIRVMYTQRNGVFFNKVPTQPIQDIAAQRNFADVNATTVEYPAVMDPVLANALGVRDLRRTSTPLGKARITVNRDAADFRVGRVFLLGWGDYGISPRVHRVGAVDYGTLTDGKIIVDAVEDIFALEQPLYNTPIDAVPLEIRLGSRQQIVVDPQMTETPTSGTLVLVLGETTGMVESVEFRTQSGNRAPSAWHFSESTTSFTATVDKHSLLQSAILWRVNGYLKDGTIGVLASGAVSFDVAARPERPAVVLRRGTLPGALSARVTVDLDTVSLRYAVSTDHEPTLTEIRAGTVVAVDPGTTVIDLSNVITRDPNQSAWIGVLAYDVVGNESFVGTAESEAGTPMLADFTFTDTLTQRIYSWTRHADAVWVYEKALVGGIGSGWPTETDTPTILPPGTDTYTITKPPVGTQIFLQFEPMDFAGNIGNVRRVIVDPAPSGLAGVIDAVVTNDTADLAITISGSQSDWPAFISLHEDRPGADPIWYAFLDGPAVFTPASTGAAALGGRALPLREMRRWYLRMQDASGIVRWTEGSADRDALPSAVVTANDLVAVPSFVVSYDDDTDAVRVTVPGGHVKLYNGLSGSGVLTYTVGDLLDDASVEDAMSPGETRTGYVVEARGGGVWVRAWTGDLHGVPETGALSGKIRPIVQNAIADLEVAVVGRLSNWPVTMDLFEGNPDGTPIATATVSTNTTLTKVDLPALGGRALPLREVLHWYARLTDVAGNVVWVPAVADRDPLPTGAVVISDYGAEPIINVTYDDDTDKIRITLPYADATKTITTDGSGTAQYYIGYDSTDADLLEAPFADGEARGPYTVEAYGGGVWVLLWSGMIHGRAVDTPTIDMIQTHGDTADTLTFSSNGTLELAIDGAAYSAAPASPLIVTLDNSTHSYSFRATLAGRTATKLVPIPALSVGSGTGYFTSVSQHLQSTLDDTVRFVWGWSGSADHFELYSRVNGGAWQLESVSLPNTDTNYLYHAEYDLSNVFDPFIVVEFYLKAMTSGNALVATSEISSANYGYNE